MEYSWGLSSVFQPAGLSENDFLTPHLMLVALAMALITTVSRYQELEYSIVVALDA